MADDLDVRRLSALVRAKRGKRGLRAVAAEIGGVSASTLSRIEQGKVPDLETFAQLCRWLGVSSDDFMPLDAQDSRDRAVLSAPGMSTPDIISAHLRADRALSPESANALAEMVRLAYEALAQGKFDTKE